MEAFFILYAIEPQCPEKALFTGQNADIEQFVRKNAVSVDETCYFAKESASHSEFITKLASF